ncbi:endopeptidase La [Thermodesulfobacteriota bacterium]
MNTDEAPKVVSDTDFSESRFTLPLLPLRDIVVFPHMVIPLFVGREKSVKALEDALKTNRTIFLATQKKASINNPEKDDIYTVGTIASIIQLLRLPDGTVKVLVESKKRAKVREYVPNENYFMVQVDTLRTVKLGTAEEEALIRTIKSTFETFVKLNAKIPPEMISSITPIDDAQRLADTVVVHLNLKLPEKQEILEMDDPFRRLEKILTFMESEIEILQVERRIKTRVKKQMEHTQKDYYLNEQMKAIQKELGEKDEYKSEMVELENNLKKKKMTEEASEKTKKELKKLKFMQPMSAEAAVIRNYIDWFLALPWGEKTKLEIDIDKAAAILDEDHHGLHKVKERILEYLAVQTLVEKMKAPILCLIGPPGVGKTSLAKSIARATGRNFIKLSFGGVKDEAEIRGHRRTYIGAMPGKIIQSLKKAKSNNPVFLMDEVDKMSTDFRGDPSSALLEVLDPEQNNAFNDHYLDVDYDLSDILFVTTANTIHKIPAPLLDRMETIRLPGYTAEEKFHIAKIYLVKKEMENNGLTSDDIIFTDPALYTIIRHYTREAGVRNLQREISAVCRKVAKEVVRKGRVKQIKVSAQKLNKYLGPKKYRSKHAEEKNTVGMVNGLAWTEVGGELLPAEVAILGGKGNLIVTGKLGEVMTESAQAALSYARSRSASLELKPDFYQKLDIHVHIPEGAIPKDGPSAGITMATAIISALTGQPVRSDIAMTGEITLRGRVLPIGGLKEKILAAHRGLIKTVIIPKENEKDLVEIPKKILKGIEIKPVSHMDEVLEIALITDPEHRMVSHLLNEKPEFDNKNTADSHVSTAH